MAEPIAVAFVEIRPDATGFRSETDSQVRRQLGDEGVPVPAEFRLTGVEQAQREINKLTREVDSIGVPIEPDLATFNADVDTALRAVGPVEVPGQLQIEGLEQANAQAQQLSQTLTQATVGPIREGTEVLSQNLGVAAEEARAIGGIGTGSIAQLGGAFTAAGASAADFGGDVGEAGDIVDQMNVTIGDSIGAGTIYSRAQDQMAGAVHNAASGIRAAEQDLTGLTSTMRDGQRTVLNLGNGVFAQVQAFDALKDAELGLIQVAPGVSAQMRTQVAEGNKLSAALTEQIAAQKALDLARVRTRQPGSAVGTFDPADPGVIEATERLAKAQAEVARQSENLTFASGEAAEAEAALAVEEHNRVDVLDEKRTSMAGIADEQGGAIKVEDALTQATRSGTEADKVAVDVKRARVAGNQALVTSEVALTDAVKAEGVAAETTEKRERSLFGLRARARRPAPIGPLRLTGAGLGVATAVFAAAQAVGALGDALAVTGEEASTAEGRLRNLGASILRFDIAGAFAALTNNTEEYSIAQLRVINQTPAMVAVLKEVGEAGNLASSATAALAGLSTEPQFLQTALAREERQGDVEGQIRVLEQLQDFYIRSKVIAQNVGGDQTEVNAALEILEKGLQTTQESLNELSLGGVGGRSAARATAISQAEQAGDLPRVNDILERQAADLRSEIDRVEKNRRDLDAVKRDLKATSGRLTATKKAIAQATEELGKGAAPFLIASRVRELLPFKLAPGPLDPIVESLAAEAQDLKDQKIKLEQKIADLKREGGNLKALTADLAEANRLIEENTQAIIDEENRHLREMLDQSTQGLQTAQLEEEAFGSAAGQIRALQAERLIIQAQLPALKAGGPLTAALYNEKLARIIAIDSEIEGIQSGITAEEERHRTELKASQDKEHQALLDRIGNQEQHLLNLVSRAQAAGQTGEKLQARLVQFYLKQSRNQKLSVEERRAFRDQFVSANNELTQLARDEGSSSKDALRNQIAAREDELQDKLTLAKLNEKSLKDDEAALRRLIAFYRKQAHNMKLSAKERRDFLIKQRQTEKDLRDLQGQTEAGTKTFAESAFEFMQTLTGFSTNLVSNLIPPGQTGGLVGGIPGGAFAPAPARPVPKISSPFIESQATTRPVSAGQGNTQIQLLRQINGELRKINRGDAHPEAHQQRKRGSAAGDFAYSGTQGL